MTESTVRGTADLQRTCLRQVAALPSGITEVMDQRPFDQLSHAEQVRRLGALARVALTSYGLEQARIVPLLHGLNAVFRVEGEPLGTDRMHTVGAERAGARRTMHPQQGRFVLRVHGPENANVAEIRSELLWLRALRRETPLVVPQPVPSLAGDLVCQVEVPGVPQPRLCVLLQWVDGRFLYNVEPSLQRLRRVGAFMAHLHRHAEGFVPPPGFVRDRQNTARLLGQWLTAPEERNRTWDGSRGPLSQEDEAVLDAAVATLRSAAEALRPQPGTFGLIHADLHGKNLLFAPGAVRAIDFDNCEFGYYAHDLAVFLAHPGHSRWPDQASKRAALLEGYRGVRPFPEDQEALLPTFMALRRLEGVPWLVRMSTHPTHGRWARMVLRETLEEFGRLTRASNEGGGVALQG